MHVEPTGATGRAIAAKPGLVRSRRPGRSRAKRLLSVVLAVVAVAGILGPAKAASASGTTCSSSWHFITHGETGRNVRPDPLQTEGNTSLFTDAIPNTDIWNQEFLFCRDPLWAPNHYAIFSNLTRKYWDAPSNNGVCACAETVTGIQQLWDVYKYDSTWWLIRYVGFSFYSEYVAPDYNSSAAHELKVWPAPLVGRMLFRISPSNLMG